MKIRVRIHGGADFRGKLRSRIMKGISKSILNEVPLGVMVFDQKMKIIYQNNTVDKFVRRYGIVPELTAMAKTIFKERSSSDKNTLSKDKPFSPKNTKGLPVNLSIRHLYSEDPYPRISVFICTKPFNSHLNVGEVIQRYNLTNKEAEILRQLVRGLRNSDIAWELNMQAHTVRDHLRSIYLKCGVRNKLELVRNIIT